MRDTLIAAVRECIDSLDPSTRLIVGYSGGMDSSVLLDLCSELIGCEVLAVHVNHGLRETADRDEAHCRAMCEERGIPLDVHCVDVAVLARERSCGVEEAGRLARHRVFAGLAEKYAPAVILLAHHADDQAETVLMNMQRGTHLRGLSGMRRETRLTLEDGRAFTVLRPLLPFWKEDLRICAEESGLSWCEDESNTDTSLERNRMRHHVLGVLRQSLPEFPEMLLGLAQLAEGAEAVFERQGAAIVLAHAEDVRGGVLLKEACLSGGVETRQALLHALRQILEERLNAGGVTGHALLSLERLLRTGRTGAVLQLPDMVRARKEADGVFLYRADAEPLPPEGELLLPLPPFRVEAFGVTVSATLHAAPGNIPECDRNDPNVQWINAASVRKPMSLRARREGDRMWPLGAPGGKKLKDILIDRKIPQRKKTDVRVIADYAGPLWVWPVCLANRARLAAESTSAIRLHMQPA